MASVTWTDDRIETLKSLWAEGLSASQIAARLGGVTRNAVIGKAHRLGLKSRPSPVKAEAPKPAKRAAPKPPQPKVETDERRVTLLDLTERMCKWPIGHPGDPDFHFCGKPSEAGLPYCAPHCLEAFQTQLPRRDRRGRS